MWEAFLLGIVQGLTEFLPISSTAHLLFVRQALGHAHPEDAFTTVIQLGTLMAVFVYFRNDIVQLARGWVQDFRSRTFGSNPESRLVWMIGLGTIPVVIVGLLLKKWLKANFYDLQSMAVVAILFAVLMAAAEFWTRRRATRQPSALASEDRITWQISLGIGCWQALALFPGASRSGTTITGGLFAGLKRETAARFSFLLSLPSVLAAGVKELYDEYKQWRSPKPELPRSLFESGDELAALVVGTVVSAVVGYLAIHWLIGFLKRYSMGVFVVYRIILGVGILVALAAGWIR
jgi:undecaprenyl-diphosphatase